MLLITRRRLALAVGGTLTAGLVLGKLRAGMAPIPVVHLGGEGSGATRAADEDLEGMSALKLTDPPTVPPDISFTTGDGIVHHLSDFTGRGMVVNLWATWCAPCVAEMPALATLARALAPADIAVMPLSSDRGGADVVRRFFSAHDITGLPVLLDPNGDAMRSWGARGIPTTVIIDKQGRERARLEGGADWGTEEAADMVRRLVG